jgi:uncharacterized protein (TIRG00374 family)
MSESTVQEIQKSLEIPTTPKKLNLKRMTVTAFKFAVSVLLIYVVLSKTNLGQIWISVKGANIYLLLMSFSLHAVGYYASSFRWQILLAAQNRKVPVSYLVQSYAVAMYFNNILPSTIGGDVVRAYDTWRHGVPKSKSITIVIVERFLGLLALLAFAVVAIFVASDFTDKIPNLTYIVLGVFALMVLATVFIFMNQRLVTKLGMLFDKPGLKLFKKQGKKFADAFKEFRGKGKALFWAMILSFVLQINVIVHYWLISEALGMEITLTKYLFIIPIALFVMMIPVSINAIGLRENLYVFFLIPYGATVAECVAFSWVAYGMILMLGIFGGVLLAFRKQGKKPEEFVENSNKEIDMSTSTLDIQDDVDKEILDTQRALFDEKKSKSQKYQELFLGEPGFLKMVKYELIITLCSWMPGALGLLLRSKLYPIILGKVGRNVAFGVNVTIRHPSKIRIGDNVVIDDNCVLDAKGEGNFGLDIGDGVFVGKNTILTCHDGDIILGDNVNIGFNCVISSLSKIEIKANTLLASYVYMVGGDHIADRTDIPVLIQGRTSKGIAVGEGCWLGAHVAILDGSDVGRDSIIGANGVVNGSIPEFSIAVGTPAKVLRDRRDQNN